MMEKGPHLMLLAVAIALALVTLAIVGAVWVALH
jgi:hypothetical protein